MVFAVKDTGIGIKDEDKSKLFKIFGKIAQNDNVNPSGIGLGLTICNKILKQMGSEIQVRSAYGWGSEFYFILELPFSTSNTECASPNTYSFGERELNNSPAFREDIHCFPSKKKPDSMT